MKRCSVLIAAFNVEAYVADAVGSALSQTYPEVEVIVVNDGSTDGTAAALAPYLDRVVYREQPNRGLAGARNRALQEATGDYIALLDGDDVWLPTRLERVVDLLDSSPEVGFATTDAYLMHGDRASAIRYYRHFEHLLNGDPFGSGDQRYWILFQNFVMGMAVARRELFDRHGGFDESLPTSEDWDLWIRFILGGERAGLVAEPLAHYRLRPDSLTRKERRMAEDALLVVERAVGRLRPGETRGLGLPLIRRAMQASALGDTRRAASFYAAAARDPDLRIATRAKARAFAAMPKLGTRVQRWRSRRAGTGDVSGR
jgi:glycosyltransferase involved in cell wall biosynthesis